ncbi:hypothetical protein V425_04315 [Lactococcus lactis RTB018]|nr:hypothetical protein V425_04315 [Lactococcus lactis RTB018]
MNFENLILKEKMYVLWIGFLLLLQWRVAKKRLRVGLFKCYR